MYSVKFPMEGESDVFGLDVSKIGSGATGTVYAFEVFGRKYAAKIIKNISDQTRDKIQTMISMSSVLRKRNEVLFDQLAWPVGEIYKEGKIVGFAMRVLTADDFIPFESFFDYNLRDRLPSSDFTSISILSELLEKLSDLLAFLHAEGIYVVDLKPQNIRVAKKDRSVFILDCDSFSFKSPLGRVFPAGFVSADYICPETMRNKLSPKDLGEGQDRYAFAVLAFQVLNRGIHPFQGVVLDKGIDAPTNDQKAELGLYAYGSVPNSQIAAHPRSVHQIWPSSLRSLFDLAFTSEDVARPSLVEWFDYFLMLATEKKFRRCKIFPDDAKHIHFSEGECVECYLSKLQNNRGWKSAADEPPIAGSPTPTPTPPSPQPPVTPKNDNLIWYVIALIAVLVVFSGIANNTPSKNSPQLAPQSVSNSTTNNRDSSTNLSVQGSRVGNNPQGSTQPQPVAPQLQPPRVPQLVPQSTASEVYLTRTDLHQMRLSLYRRLQVEAMPPRITLPSRTSSSSQIEYRVSSLPLTELNYIRNLARLENIRLISDKPNQEIIDLLLTYPNQPRPLVFPEIVDERAIYNQWSSYQKSSDNMCIIASTATSVGNNFVPFIPELRGIVSPRSGGGSMDWQLVHPVPFDIKQPIFADVDGVRFELEVVGDYLMPMRLDGGPKIDASVTRAMRAGNSMRISGKNALTGSGFSVQFSLIGFTRAFSDMMSRCNRGDLRVWIYND